MQEYKICTQCIMDTSDPDITFDSNGVCNHCTTYDEKVNLRTFQGEEAKKNLDKLLASIKSAGKNKDYDCIVGVSGGVDSTYVAYMVKKFGLRPLAIHFDNGWNSELAVQNIENTLKKLDIDLYTYVIDWEVFKDLQMSFLKASTPDGEIPTDHAINAFLFQEASKRGIKYIISGMNYATESSAVRAWAYGHSDWKYIRSVHKIFGKTSLKKYPHFNIFHLFYYTFIKRIKVAAILNYLDFNKEKAMEVLQKDLGWVYYGGKHYESVYTRFYQAYVLPKKFNIDKRRIHLSDLIRSKQLTREVAMTEIQKDTCDPKLMDQDKDFVCKKFEITPNQFQSLMELPKKLYSNYPNSYELILNLKKIVNFLRKLGLYTK